MSAINWEAPRTVHVLTYPATGGNSLDLRGGIDVPHRRVAGIHFRESTTVWDRDFHPSHNSEPNYYALRKNEITSEELTVTTMMFYGLRLALDHRDRQEGPSDCHTFTEYLRGNHDSDGATAREAMRNILQTGEKVDPLLTKLGETLVLGYQNSDGVWKPIHSVTRLEENGDKCIQITNADGYLAISSLKAAWDAQIPADYRTWEEAETVGFYKATS